MGFEAAITPFERSHPESPESSRRFAKLAATRFGRFIMDFLSPAFIAAEPELGLFDHPNDVGNVKISGASLYDAPSQTYTLAGAGLNMWLDTDEFHGLWKAMKGDFILTARARFVGEGVNAHRKLGWIVRASLDARAPHINAVVHGDGLTSLQFRRTAGAQTEESKSALTGADVIQLERRGQTYLLSVAPFGEPFTTHQVEDLKLGDEVLVGLFVCSHETDVLERAVFENVRTVVPTGEGFKPYRDYLGSRLEVLEVQSGARRVVFSSPDGIEAPNWTPDGKALIYNSQGRLFRFDLESGTSKPIDTGLATRNNNDHVLSFDGQMLGISSAPEGGTSTVYTVPVEGGQPTLITPLSPSYLHGWSPDGEWLAYTGQRGGAYDIYKIPSRGGQEIRLTEAPGLDDSSEFSPDNRIYFNSSRTGTMQLWRMDADGQNQEQLTDDAYQNWFPHVSPDGQHILFLSYEPDVPAQAHPYYQPVMLRLMPIAGGAARVVAYLYGGQGTINVPSWSPDGKYAAFVSNSG